MARGFESEHFEQEGIQQSVNKITEQKETKQYSALEKLFSQKDLDHFYNVLTPKLETIRESVFHKENNAQELRKNFEVALGNTLYETRNVPKEMLVDHFRRTINDVYTPQFRVLEHKQYMLEQFQNAPEQSTANEYLWKCKHLTQELHEASATLINGISANPPSTTEETRAVYLKIADSIWAHNTAFGNPEEWLQEFVGNIAKNESKAADSILNELSKA